MTRVVAAAWVVPGGGERPVRDGAIAFDAGRVVAVGARAAIEAAYPGADREDFGPTAVIVPGLVNAHTHLEYTILGGFDDGAPFATWMRGLIGRMRLLSADGFLLSARAGALSCLASGVTAVGDCSYSGAALDAAREAGLRGVVHVETFGRDARTALERLEPRLGELTARSGPLLQVGVSPHSAYTVAPDAFAAVASLARERDLPLAIHVAESTAEIDALRDGSGPLAAFYRGAGLEPSVLGGHPLPRLIAEGLAGPGMAAIHCVEVDERDVAMLAGARVGVVHCPRSNAQLGCGLAPVAALRRAGVTVALGSDSPASAPDFDLFSEMRAALAAARSREQDAAALTAHDVFAMATSAGAEILGLGGLAGALAPGRVADFAVVDMAGSPYWPTDDPITAVVLGGAACRVAGTSVGGELRYRQTRDSRRVSQAVSRAASLRASMFEEAVPP